MVWMSSALAKSILSSWATRSASRYPLCIRLAMYWKICATVSLGSPARPEPRSSRRCGSSCSSTKVSRAGPVRSPCVHSHHRYRPTTAGTYSGSFIWRSTSTSSRARRKSSHASCGNRSSSPLRPASLRMMLRDSLITDWSRARVVGGWLDFLVRGGVTRRFLRHRWQRHKGWPPDHARPTGRGRAAHGPRGAGPCRRPRWAVAKGATPAAGSDRERSTRLPTTCRDAGRRPAVPHR